MITELNIGAILMDGFTITAKFVLNVSYLLTELTYWCYFHFLFITLYVSPASCPFHYTGLDLGLTVLWSH